jgi:hypothetical protein
MFLQHNQLISSAPDSHEKALLKLAAKKKLLRARDLAPFGMPTVVLTRLVASGKLERVARGVYGLPARSLGAHAPWLRSRFGCRERWYACCRRCVSMKSAPKRRLRYGLRYRSAWLRRDSISRNFVWFACRMPELRTASLRFVLMVFACRYSMRPKRWPIASSTGTRLASMWRWKRCATLGAGAKCELTTWALRSGQSRRIDSRPIEAAS